MRLHGTGEAAVLQQAKGRERRLHVDAAGAVTHHQQPGLREAPVQACEGLHQQRQAVPGFQRAQKADDDRGLVADVGMARGPQLGAIGAGRRIHAIGHHMHAPLRAGPGVQVVGHAGRDGQNGAGLREGRLSHGTRLVFQHQLAMGALLLDERRVHFQNARDAVFAGPAHAHVAPERVALVDHVVGGVGVEPLGNVVPCLQGSMRALGRVTLRDFRQVDAGHVLQTRRDMAVEAGGKQRDAVAGLQGGTHHRLHVDRGSLGAEDRDAGIGADVGDVFLHGGSGNVHSTALGRCAASWASTTWMLRANRSRSRAVLRCTSYSLSMRA